MKKREHTRAVASCPATKPGADAMRSATEYLIATRRPSAPELLRDIHRNSDIDPPLLNSDESWTLPIPARFILDRAGVIAYSEINPGHPAALRRETPCPCWTICATWMPLEPRTAKRRRATGGIWASNVHAFRAAAKCADQRVASPREGTTPAIWHDSNRKASR